MRLAWEMNRMSIIIWTAICALVALLPAAALIWQKDILKKLTVYIATGTGEFSQVAYSIIILGSIMILIGISVRLNSDFLFAVVYDYYYIGLSEKFMDLIQKVEVKTLNQKGVQDEYRYVRYRFGELASLMADFFVFITQTVSIISLLILALTYSGVIFWATVGYLIVVVVINQALTEKRTYSYVQDRDFIRRTEYFESIVMQSGVAKELRIFHNAGRMMKEWEEAYDPILKRDKRIGRWSSTISFLCSLGYYCLMVCLLIYSVHQVSKKSMGVDVFLVLYGMAQSMSVAIHSFSNTFHHIKRRLFDLGRMKKFMQSVPTMKERAQAQEMQEDAEIVFEAKNVSFSYDDKKEILHNLNFQIRRGETVALVGLNGSGKSTLMKLLIELYQPTQGTLYFCGKPYDQYQKESISRNIGMFFQDFVLFHASMQENVGFGDLKSIEDESKILAAIKKGGAEKLLEKLPNGLATWLIRKVRKDGVNLSGGEQQKVAVSRAHMSDKDILIFDEPASALDPIAEMEQFAAIREKISGRTAVLISHRVGFARLADRIMVLEYGKLVESGSHDELIAQNGTYAKFFQAQAGWYDIAKGGQANEE
jgi:ATP-binding cassette subfamily B protein